MVKTKSGCFAVVIGLLLSVSVLAQGNSGLFLQIESAVKQKAPGWKLAHRLVSKRVENASYLWKSGKSSVGVLIFVHDTPEQANRTYHHFDLEDFGLKRKVLEGPVLELGDENYAWQDVNDPKTVGIDFRKGRAFVHITASTLESARQFASLIADTLPAS